MMWLRWDRFSLQQGLAGAQLMQLAAVQAELQVRSLLELLLLPTAAQQQAWLVLPGSMLLQAAARCLQLPLLGCCRLASLPGCQHR